MSGGMHIARSMQHASTASNVPGAACPVQHAHSAACPVPRARCSAQCSAPCTRLHVVRLAEEEHGLAAATEAERRHARAALARLPTPHE
jgi:hypothetical protein